MALPSYTEQTTLEIILNGLPYVRVASDATVLADGIHYTINGLPQYATRPAGGGITYNTAQFFILM